MHDFWTIPTANMMYTRLQNYTDMVFGKHGKQTFEGVVVVLLLFDVFFLTSAQPFLLLVK